MREGDRGSDQEALTQAHEMITRQAQEIERLRGRLADERFAEELREVLRLAASVSVIASPVSHSRLLEMIVETAADVINAQAASLFLINEEAQELVFEVALGQKAEEVKKFRVPLGHGIAGLVAVTGQPLAVADVQNDPHVATDIAQSIGYVPRNILCVPLFYNDQVIGVLELLDKEDAPTFSTTDLESLGLFANQAAVAIEQSRGHRSLGGLLTALLGSLDGFPMDRKRDLQQRARDFADRSEEDAISRRTLDLAYLVQEIAYQGEHELWACQTILRGFAEYLRLRRQDAGDLGATR